MWWKLYRRSGEARDRGQERHTTVGECGRLRGLRLGRGMETLPEHFKSRTIQLHSKLTFAVKATKDEMAATANLMAEKLNRSTGPVTVVLPMRGFSERDGEGKVFFDPGRQARLPRRAEGTTQA